MNAEWIDKTYHFAVSDGVHGDDYVSATDLGTDKSAAMQTAINTAITDKKILVMPPHAFIRMDAMVTWSASTDLKLIIDGNNATLVANGDVNSTGLLKLECTSISKTMDIEIKDLSFSAASPISGGVVNCGRGLQIIHSPAPGLRGFTSVLLENVEFYSLNNDQGYFSRPLYIEGAWFVHGKNVRSNQLLTANLTDAANKYRNNWLAFVPESACHLKEVYGFFFEDCMFRCGGGLIDGTEGAAFVSDTNGSAEGGILRNCTANYSRTGVQLRGTSNEPGFTMLSGHINARDYCVDIQRGKNLRFSGILAYLDDGMAGANPDGAADPSIFKCGTLSGSNIIVEGVDWHYAAHQNLANARFFDSNAVSTQTYFIRDNKVGDTTLFKHGFSSSTQHTVFASGNAFAHGTIPFSNDAIVGYQYEEMDNLRRRITGYNSPAGNTFPGTLTNGDLYIDPNIMAGSDTYRLTDAGAGTWTRF